ncbi:ABC transporter permease [Haliangium sp.]|uniref:ABC transporter permease n=1 Tax=Haliangium sp. TaxID=2663208 RepID=UPI003D0AE1C9
MIRREVYTILIALAVAAVAGSLLIMVVGQSPLEVYRLLLLDTWGNDYGFGQVIFKTTPLILTGLAVAMAFQVGLFNIGGEGQMVAGSFATALCGTWLPEATPWPIAIPLCLGAGVLAGGTLGAIPGVLKARYGAHEVINTIMLNFIATAVVLWLGNEYLFVAHTTHTWDIIDAAHLSPLGSSGSAANTSFFLAIVVAVLMHLFLQKTRVGFEWRAVGLNPRAAENGGISVARSVIGGMTAAGALAGMVGANYVLGYKHYFEEGIGRGVGFMGIAVALLGRNHPIGIIFAALLFGTLSQGGLAVNALVPKELVDVLQAVIILAVAGASAWMRRTWNRRGGT